MFFLSNSQIISFVGTSHPLEPGQEIHCLGILTTQMFEKKLDSFKFPYLAKFFIFQNLSLPSFLLPLFKLCLITTIQGLLVTFSAKTLIKHDKFGELNSEIEKKVNLIQAKKPPRRKRIRSLRFYMRPFPDVYQAFSNH